MSIPLFLCRLLEVRPGDYPYVGTALKFSNGNLLSFLSRAISRRIDLVDDIRSTFTQRSSHWTVSAQIHVSAILNASVSLFGGHFVRGVAVSSVTASRRHSRGSQDDVAAAAPRSEGGRRRNPGDNGRKWFFVRVASRVDVITPNHRVPGGPPASPPSRSAALAHWPRRRLLRSSLVRVAAASLAALEARGTARRARQQETTAAKGPTRPPSETIYNDSKR